MATDQTIASRYIAHGLALIRAANGMSRDVDAQLVKLGNDIRYLLARDELSDLGKRALNALLSDINDAIFQRYNVIADNQSTDLAHLVEIEAAFAVKAGDYNNMPSATQLAGVIPGLLILGATLKDYWRKLATDFAYRANAAVKAAQRTTTAEGANKAAISTIFGQKRADGQPAGDIGTARRAAAALVQTGAHAASQDARVAAFKANGVKFFEWHAVLDAKVCPVCAMRSGKLYTIDGEPVGHDVPFIAIPVHPWDRCILLPHAGEPPADGGKSALEFNEWLMSLTEEQENELLGVGRADLYRRGEITLNDLINQSGRLLTLAELKATL
jgi:SPP1 gp7 family putative phage head morphogenesis protein